MRALRVVLAALLLVLLTAGPASAHGLDAAGVPGDYRTAVTSAAVPGVQVAVVEAGARLELRWSGPGELLVLGEQGEPFLRLTPAGVEEDLDSPTAWRARDRRGTTPVPPGTGSGTPRWQWVQDEPVARWHEHRAHWTGLEPPPEVAADPGTPRRVRDWTVPLLVDGRPAQVAGTLDFVPPRPVLPWLGVGVAAGLLAALALRRPGTDALACAVIAAAEVLRTLGTGLAAADGRTGAVLRAGGLALPGAVLLVVAAVGLRRGRPGALVLGALGGALVALTGALPATPVLTDSVPLTALPAGLTRAAVAVGLGGGLGLLGGLVAAFSRLPRPEDRDAAQPVPA